MRENTSESLKAEIRPVNQMIYHGLEQREEARMDTGISFTDGEFAYASSDDPGIKTAWMKMMQQWPDEIKILKRPDENDGCLYIRLPLKMARHVVKRLIPSKREPMSEERKVAAAERMKAYQAAKKEGSRNEQDDQDQS